MSASGFSTGENTLLSFACALDTIVSSSMPTREDCTSLLLQCVPSLHTARPDSSELQHCPRVTVQRNQSWTESRSQHQAVGVSHRPRVYHRLSGSRKAGDLNISRRTPKRRKKKKLLLVCCLVDVYLGPHRHARGGRTHIHSHAHALRKAAWVTRC